MGTPAEADPDWEYAPLRIPPDVSRITAAVRLALHAEFGGWELARTLRYTDGTRRVVLRRRRRPNPGGEAVVLPLPRLSD
jgi:hypothetical protein